MPCLAQDPSTSLGVKVSLRSNPSARLGVNTFAALTPRLRSGSISSLRSEIEGPDLGSSAAHGNDPLPLLPSGPGGVHGVALHEARSLIRIAILSRALGPRNAPRGGDAGRDMTQDGGELAPALPKSSSANDRVGQGLVPCRFSFPLGQFRQRRASRSSACGRGGRSRRRTESSSPAAPPPSPRAGCPSTAWQRPARARPRPASA